MAKSPRTLLVANWKMNPRTLEDALALFAKVRASAAGVVFAVPQVYLSDLIKRRGRSRALFAAQDLSTDASGPHTGEVGASMLKSLGVTHVIIGHSERRARGESDEQVAAKLAQAVKVGLHAIVCIGERERDAAGRYFSVIEAQIHAAFRGFPSAKLKEVTIAYEPIWAISTATPGARAATPEDAHEMVIFIKKTIADLYGRTAAARVNVLYGGSVDDKNISDLLARSGAQGFLVGGTSLKPREFLALLRIIHGK